MHQLTACRQHLRPVLRLGSFFQEGTDQLNQIADHTRRFNRGQQPQGPARKQVSLLWVVDTGWRKCVRLLPSFATGALRLAYAGSPG